MYTISWALRVHVNTLSKVFQFNHTREKGGTRLSENSLPLLCDRRPRVRRKMNYSQRNSSHLIVLLCGFVDWPSGRGTAQSTWAWIHLQRPVGVYLPSSFVCTSNYCLCKVTQTSQDEAVILIYETGLWFVSGREGNKHVVCVRISKLKSREEGPSLDTPRGTTVSPAGLLIAPIGLCQTKQHSADWLASLPTKPADFKLPTDSPMTKIFLSLGHRSSFWKAGCPP